VTTAAGCVRFYFCLFTRVILSTQVAKFLKTLTQIIVRKLPIAGDRLQVNGYVER
jgi:hypothetical protein